MIPLFEREFVKRYGFLSDDEFYDALVICQSLPGVIAVNFAVYIGLKLRGRFGALVSALGVTLPSFIIIMVIATFVFRHVDNEYVVAIFKGVRVSVIALVFTAGYRLFIRHRHWYGVFIAFLTFTLVAIAYVHPFLVIVMMGAYGYLTTKIAEVVRHDAS